MQIHKTIVIHLQYLMLWMAITFISCCAHINSANSFESNNDEYDLLNEVLEHVEAEHINEWNKKQLITEAIKGLLSKIDIYSEYLDTDEYGEILTLNSGKFGGIGLEISEDEKGIVRISKIYEDSPASMAEINKGDIIFQIDNIDVSKLDRQNIAKKLRGEAGSIINICAGSNHREMKCSKIKRSIMEIAPILTCITPKEKICYVKISIFNAQTADMVQNKIERCIKRKSNIGFIIDLRSNPGGVFEQAEKVADLFLDKGIITVIKGSKPESDKIIQATSGDIANGGIIFVLINEESASAAEIVASALKENNRAMVLGTKSFGKGLIQEIISLSNGDAIKLTSREYYTPNGNSIEARGITPDVELPPFDGSEYANTMHDIKHYNKIKNSVENCKENIYQDLQITYAINIMNAILQKR
ncbi:MAG: S41 family peptidase [Proteobacteria bacterium]|nr:S41 family peptidase [Pseudomonadota bacterium]